MQKSIALHRTSQDQLTENILLRQPLPHQHVVRDALQRHLVLPDDSLFELLEGLHEHISVLRGHRLTLSHGAETEVHDAL